MNWWGEDPAILERLGETLLASVEFRSENRRWADGSPAPALPKDLLAVQEYLGKELLRLSKLYEELDTWHSQEACGVPVDAVYDAYDQAKRPSCQQSYTSSRL